MKIGLRVFLLTVVCFAVQYINAQTGSGAAKKDSVRSVPDFHAYDLLRLPHIVAKASAKRIITVAVIDDAFSMTNSTCKNYFYRNDKEIPNNGKDDDGNGYIDDLYGWNAADNDNDVSIPEGKVNDFYHGTMVAGIIIKVLERSFDAPVSDFVRIMPIKIFSDKNKSAAYEHGYEGIAYAVKQGADIICCAWSGLTYDAKYKALFDEAERKGILIIAAAGDTYSDHIDAPGNLSSIFTIAAVDSLGHKTKISAYGAKVDAVASGDALWAPHPFSDKAFIYSDGTAAATALAAGCAAVLKVAETDADYRAVAKALKNTARPIDSLNVSYAGKLGAGLIDLTAAYDFLINPDNQEGYFLSSRPKGDIAISKKTKTSEWLIAPHGGYRGFNFTLGAAGTKMPSATLKFYSADTPFADVALKEFPLKLFVPGAKIKVAYEGQKGKDPITLSYAAEALDSATLYCNGVQVLDKDHGMITDGSGTANYTNRCDCKWQIKAPAGEHIKISFEEMDTEPNKDFVWIFDGQGTQQSNLIAKFSGQNKPPVITSRTNEVLLWFVSDDARTGKGWRLHYDFVDTPSGYERPVKKN